ncbi:MAG: hypothetical protein K2J40_08285 [Ruminococcus sp.]|nr:hypothetical protein [Ruminococcus sp.]
MNRDFYLSSLDIPVTEEYDFNYMGVSGYAEIIGCKIAFFRKNKNSLLNAFSFIEIQPEEFAFCNSVLEKIDFPIRFGDTMEKVREIFGTEDSVDTFFENYVRYNYSAKKPFMSFSAGKYITGIDVNFQTEHQK